MAQNKEVLDAIRARGTAPSSADGVSATAAPIAAGGCDRGGKTTVGKNSGPPPPPPPATRAGGTEQSGANRGSTPGPAPAAPLPQQPGGGARDQPLALADIT